MTTLLFLYVASSVLLCLVALPMYLGKIPPNLIYGFRVRKTLENPDLWYRANRYSAGWLMFAGVLTALGAILLYFVPGLGVDGYAILCLAVFVISFGIGMQRSMSYINRD